MEKKPLVTVLMPVYNGEKYLREAIESILNQTYKNFEFLIIDDGSTDNSKQIIKSYKDSRINLVSNGRNLKLINSLNKGIDLSSGKYIARMDCDDISMPRRLEKQVNFMEKNKDVIMCGTGVKILESKWKRTFPITGWENIKYKLLIENCIYHPSVMIRTDVLKDNRIYYDSRFIHAEDFELWQRISKKYKIENIRKPLLKYRHSTEGIGRKYQKEQIEMASRISKQGLSEYNIILNKDYVRKEIITKEDILNAKKQIENIQKENHFTDYEHQKILAMLWLSICKQGVRYGFWTLKVFYSIKNVTLNYISLMDKNKLFIKCLRNFITKKQ
ncbi:glycosyltransferase family 2 protein [Heyndrickxia coagulans]|uniref:Glycosyltransferase family 2 protein n=1 Tax=Heyndrickxia coagulans TaxID=1398 RepID=A0AAW7CE35_HEYCO|nr:glycosyltransferase family 2 protein [Heyndrickxia coagulans]MDL5039750.1 glycosyltransferase family 2 protein [Heyndrickxia coagulans]